MVKESKGGAPGWLVFVGGLLLGLAIVFGIAVSSVPPEVWKEGRGQFMAGFEEGKRIAQERKAAERAKASTAEAAAR